MPKRPGKKQQSLLNKSLSRKCFNWLVSAFPFLTILSVVCVFFFQVFLGKVPLPGDLIVGGYYPWLDYNWGFPTGVPVKNPITSDAVSFIYPMRMAAIDFLKNGEWPLWNPYLLSGTPLLANFQSAPFSLTNLFYFVFDHLTAWSMQIMVQHVLAAGFVYLLLRNWNVSRFSSTVAGIIYAFTGFNLLWSEWNAHTLTASFIPLLLLFSDKFLLKGNYFYIVAISVVVGLQFLSGYPQIVIYAALALFSLWAIRLQRTKTFFTRTCVLVLAGILGVGLAALQILPGYELITLSQRASEVIPTKWVFLDWREIILFVAPDYYGNHATQNYWGHKNYLSTLGFVGVANLILASVGLGLVKAKKEIGIACLIGVSGLVLAFQTPISNFLWETNFLGYQAGVSYRSLVLFCLSVALLAGFGLDRIRQEKTVNFFAFFFPGLILLGFGTVALLALYKIQILSLPLPHENLERFQVALHNLILPTGVFVSTFLFLALARKLKTFTGLSVLMVITLSLLEMFYFGWKFTPFTDRDLIYPETPVISYLKKQEEPFRVTAYGAMPVNQGMPYKLEFPGGYDAVYPYPMAKYISTLNSNNVFSAPQDRFGIIDREQSPLLDITNTKYVVSRDSNLAEKYNYEKVFQDKSVIVWENHNSYERIKMFFNWETLKDEGAILTKLLDAKHTVENKVIVDKDLPEASQGDHSLKYEKYSPQESLIRYTSSKPGVLFISQQWYPGWQAFIDGQSAEIFKANYAFQGIYAPAGEHLVKTVYNPESFRMGLKITAASFITLLFIGLVVAKAKRRNYT